MRSPLRVEYFSDLDRNEDSSRTFPRVWCRAFAMGSPVSGCVAYFCALDRNKGLFHPSILNYFAMGSPYGSSVVFLPTRSERSLLWIAGRYSFRMGSPFLGQVLTIWSRVKELLKLGSWEHIFRAVLWVSFRYPLVDQSALKSGRVPHSVVFASGGDSVCTPLANEGVGLGPSSSGPVASCPPLVDRSASSASRWFLSPGRFMRWSYTHGGLLAALLEVGLLSKGCWRIVRVPQILYFTPLPGVRSSLLFLTSRYGRCSRKRHFHVAWNPPLSQARDCSSLSLRIASLSLKLSRSEVPGPHVLLSYYVTCIISCGPGVLSSFVTLPGLSLWFFWACLGLCGAPPDIRSAFFWFWKRSSSWPLPRLGALGVPCYAFSWLSFQGLGWGVLCFHPGLREEDSGPLLPCSSVCGLHCTGPTNARQSQWETVISCAGGQVLHVPLGLRIVRDVSGSLFPQSVAWRSYRRPLSPSGSGCRCHGCAGSRSWSGLFCVLWARSTRAVAPSLLWEELYCHPGGGARMWLLCSSLWGCYLGAVVPRFLAAFHRFCVVAVQALVLPGPVRLDISLLTTWGLVLGTCFLVRSPTIRRLPMECHGWGFVYVATFWSVVCIISWKYWITFLQNLSFLLKLCLILSLPQLLASSCPGSYGREGGSAGLCLHPPASMAPDPQRLSG